MVSIILCIRCRKWVQNRKKAIKQFGSWLAFGIRSGEGKWLYFELDLRPEHCELTQGRALEPAAGGVCSYLGSSGWLPSGFPSLQGQRQLQRKPGAAAAGTEYQPNVCDGHRNEEVLRCKTVGANKQVCWNVGFLNIGKCKNWQMLNGCFS